MYYVFLYSAFLMVQLSEPYFTSGRCKFICSSPQKQTKLDDTDTVTPQEIFQSRKTKPLLTFSSYCSPTLPLAYPSGRGLRKIKPNNIWKAIEQGKPIKFKLSVIFQRGGWWFTTFHLVYITFWLNEARSKLNLHGYFSLVLIYLNHLCAMQQVMHLQFFRLIH